MNERPQALDRAVTPTYFIEHGIRLLAGRSFSERDRGNQPAVAIVSDGLARRLWPDANPVGSRSVWAVPMMNWNLLNDYQANGRKSFADVRRRIDLALARWFGKRRLATVSTLDIRAYVTHRQKQEAANATINRELAALKRMYTLAIQSGRLLHRPYIPMLQERNVRQGFFEREQFIAVRGKAPPVFLDTD